MTLRRASVGVSAHLGWAATASIAVSADGPRVLRTDRLEIARPEERAVREPYHVAGGFDGLERVPRPRDPAKSLAAGLRRQRRAAGRCIDALSEALAEAGFRPAVAGLLVGRGRAAERLEQAIGSHTQIHVEEGLAVRAAFREALAAAGARVLDVDQKTVAEDAAEAFGEREADLFARLRARRPEAGGAWRKEEQTAALAAWLAWHRAASGGRRGASR